ncbi:MAG: glycosyltransferase family 2 protein [Candidatus Omnitrophica bacterium]|nr:glycosyltransferase family 2 protein [Candidatus Omnitrophota bacterium]
MQHSYTKENLSPEEHKLQRVLEILPGATSWTILIGMIVLAVKQPLWAAILIIAIDLYWLFKLTYMTIFLLLSYFRLKTEEETDWKEKILHVDNLDHYLQNPARKPSPLNVAEFFSWRRHHEELNNLKNSGELPPPSSHIIHAILFPVSKEAACIIESSLESLRKQSFDSRRILIIFAVEERADESIKTDILNLQNNHQTEFFDILVFFHPDQIPGEARVKGANVTYAARKTTDFLAERNIAFKNVILSCFDADTIVSPNYLDCLTYHFLVTPKRYQTSFQPIPVYHNNIWQVPGFARVIETGSSFFQLIEATNPEKLVTFSSHSMSLKALIDVDYWPVDMISDDSAIFWKCYIHFNGQYKVVPILTTLSMDVAGSNNWFETVRAVYKQKRRWAWGVENFPIVVRLFLKNKAISRYDKIKHTFKMFEAHVSWSSWGFLLSIIGWLPIFYARQDFTYSVISYNAPRVMGIIFNLAGLSLVISILMSLSLLPKSDRRFPIKEQLIHALEWCTLPLILTFLSSLPALDAQTRLMLGRYMEFWVTDKHRTVKR